MPGTTPDQSSYDWPSLSSDQQRLLLQALSSNDRRLNMDEFRNFQQAASSSVLSNTDGVDPHVFESAPRAGKPLARGPPIFGSGLLPDFSNDESTGFDVDLPQDLVDGLSEFANGDSGEKRKSAEDDDDQEDGDAKRRDNGERLPKKPGRKPLMVEPTTKRKAQNRAAQRAFRERKEQHLKELETKIDDLTHATRSTNHENSILRAHVGRLQDELVHYKKRLSSTGGIGSGSPPTTAFGSFPDTTNSGNPFDFTFGGNDNFENFPSTESRNERTPASSHSSNAGLTEVKRESTSRSNSNGWSPESLLNDGFNSSSQSPVNRSYREPSAPPANVFTPGFFELGSPNYGFPQFGSPSPMQKHLNSAAGDGKALPNGESRGSSHSVSSHAPSPTASSSWQNGTSSSCGTSPEPWNDTSAEKPAVPKDQYANTTQVGNLKDFQFDPTLFGGYRESQDAIFGDGDFSGGLYDDFLNMPDNDGDFDTTYEDNGVKSSTQTAPKPNLMEQVARQREGLSNGDLDIVDNSDQRQMMTCHKIWQQLQTCPKFQEGELDIDGLCSELSKKATCTETGANIPKDEWEAALWRMVGQPDGGKREKGGESEKAGGGGNKGGVPGLAHGRDGQGQIPSAMFTALLSKASR